MHHLLLSKIHSLLAVGLLAAATITGTAQAEDIIKGRIINTHGQGLAGVEVKLVDRENTMMDVTRSGPGGYYVIDLSTLEDDELATLRGFSLVAGNKGQRPAKKSLAGSKKPDGDVEYQAIVMAN